MSEIDNTVEGIAIVGMAGRFPRANNIDTFWDNLRNGIESISFFTDEELLASGISPEILQQSDYVKAKGVLDDIDCFDAEFFGYTPREAEFMDPQQRLFMECTWHALEHAGYDPKRYKGWIGVFGGAGDNNYLHYILSHSDDPVRAAKETHVFFGNYRDFMISRVSYKLNLKGPGITVQTACSTSLVAINLACQSLLSYECDMALAGGCSVSVPQKSGYIYEKGGIPSPDGHCRAFDEQAQGTLRGDGVGIVVLKRLEDAIADNDSIYAIIKGFATNNDGSDKIGYTAPGIEGQTEVISLAQEMAGGDIEAISYIETHGTGTSLGDPVEMTALTNVFRNKTDKKGFCRIGSVKTNLGHLDAAAGVASVIKTTLALNNEEIPPSLHFKKPNPKIDFENSPFYVNTTLSPWKRCFQPRRAGISSFGIGGTNAHIVLEEAPEAISSPEDHRPYQLIVLSAKTANALDQSTENLKSHFRNHPDTNLTDAAYTLQVGRGLFEYRRFILCKNNASLITPTPDYLLTQKCSQFAPSVIFMFPGQGSQYIQMARGLYEEESVFRKDIDNCAEILLSHLGIDIRSILYPAKEEMIRAREQINQTAFAQPIIFALEYALAKLLMAWGIIPKAMIGHSIGEYVAASVAGVFSIEDALKIVSSRGKLMQELPKGSMFSIPLSWNKVEKLLKNKDYGKLLSLAAENAPESIVLSGSDEIILQLEKDLTKIGVTGRRLHTSHAFHSAMMIPCLNTFSNTLKTITLNAPKIPFISNLTGTWISSEEACDPNYWVNHLRETVQFSKGIRTLSQESNHVFIEIGAGISLTSFVRKHLDRSEETPVLLGTLPHAKSNEPDYAVLLSTLGRLWLTGVKVDWLGFNGDEIPHRIPLPLYPFSKHSHWFKPQTKKKKESVKEPVFEDALPMMPPKKVENMADWFYVPVWKKTVPLLPIEHNLGGSWLFFVDECGIGEQLISQLERDIPVFKVFKGNTFNSISDGSYSINPQQKEDYEKLLETLTELPKHIVYLWGIGDTAISSYSYYNEILFLSQSLGKYISTQKLFMTILTTQMQPVSKDDEIIPEKSILLGPCKVIPLEYPNIRCRSVDFTLQNSGNATLIAQLLTELMLYSDDPIVAYRDKARFIQKFEQRQIIVQDTQNLLRHSGVYLITGGLGGVGLAIAEYLAKNFNAKLALVGRSKFPEKNTWAEWMTNGIEASLEEWQDSILQEEARLHRHLAIQGIKNYPGLEKQLIDLCCAYSYQYLAEGVEKRTRSIDEIKATHKVQQKFEKFFVFMLRLLTDNNYALIEGDEVTFNESIPEPEILWSTIKVQFPGFEGITRLLNHCAQNYPRALSGEISGISVLYPDGKYDFLEECEKQTVEHSYEPIYRQLLSYILKNVIHTEHRPTRILEVGAGNGLLTWELISALKDKNIEYYFTDIGSAFVLKAQKKADTEGISFMNFSVLDIAKSPIEQGFERESFDIIVGMNVVHATPHIEATLFNLDLLLAPHGLLGLIETIHSYPWVDMAWGLTDGWWYFEDYPLRTQSPLISLEKWENILKGMKYCAVKSFPETAEARMNTDIGLILAQKQSELPEVQGQKWSLEMNKRNRIQYHISRIRQMEAFGAEVEVLSADVSNRAQVADVLSKVTERFGTLNGLIHSALVLKDGMMQLKEADVARDVMLPKIDGTNLLYDLVKDKGLDFFALFSSLASIMGLYAQSDYCAASAYQDAFAHHHQRANDKLPIVSINWGLWQDTGAAMRTLMEKMVAESWPAWVNYPLYDYCVNSEKQITYYGRIGLEKDWIVKEHRLVNQAVLPGTAYLEFASAAFRHHTKCDTFEMQDVYFLEPLVVPEEKKVEFQTILEKAKDGFSFSIKSSDTREHARGLIINLKDQSPVRHNISALKRLCPNEQAIKTEEYTEADKLKKFGPVLVGPRWYSLLQEVRHGVNQAMAFVVLPEKCLDDLWHYHLHPAMVDIATSFALGEGSFYLPFSYQKIRVYKPLPNKFYSHARYLEDSTSGQETLSYEILLIDEEGNVCVSIEDYTLRKIDPEAIKLEEAIEIETGHENLASPDIHPELKEGMTSSEGAKAFELALNQSLPQVMISTQHLEEVFMRNKTGRIIANKAETLQEFQQAENRIKSQEVKVDSFSSSQGYEGQLRSIWKEVLGLDEIGFNDNFFELNGDSILAIMVSTRIRSSLNVDVTPDLLFNAPTIRLLANAIKDKVNKKDMALPQSINTDKLTDKRLPLTFSQQRMWYLNQHVPKDDVYIIPGIYKISGPLNIIAFKKSLEALIERHDALRTDFAIEDGHPVQVIHATGSLDLREENFLHLPANEREKEAIHQVSLELKKPFNLPADSPLRLMLINYDKDEYLFLMNLHNIIADGWSIGILNREIGLLYEAFNRNNPSSLEELSTNYSDFTIWQTTHFKEKRLEEEISYWMDKFVKLPITKLPYDTPPSESDTQRGKSILIELSPELVERVKAFNKQHGSTMFRTLCATYGLLIHLYTKQDIVCVWTPYANRNQQNIEAVVGIFVNALPMTINCTENPTFSQLLQQFNESYIELTAHTYIPFEQIINKHDIINNPLTRAEFIYHNYSLAPVKLGNVNITNLDISVESAGYDMEMHLWETAKMDISDSKKPGYIQGEFYYNSDCFKTETANRIIKDFYTLIERVVTTPNESIEKVKL
ncbi:MAG: acyltransferase domain-containing protein [Thiomargarita sp.]|nr:acyltransferase domain-containing protein [Thiomargarita sp.]